MTGSFVDVIGLHAAQTPDSLAACDARRKWTYRDLWTHVERAGSALTRQGVHSGHRVATTLPQNAEHLATLIGIMATGAGAAPLNVRLADRELAHYLDVLQPDLVIGNRPPGYDGPCLSGPDLFSRPSGSWRPAEPTGSEPAILIGTGGTTGTPKSAVWSTGGLATYLAASALALEARRTDIEVYFAPFFHIALATCALTTLYAGGGVHFEPRFDAGRVAAILAEGKANRLFGPPTALTRIIDDPSFEPSRMAAVRSVLFGSTAAAPDLPTRLRSAFPDATLVTGYGATEFGAVTRLRSWDADHRFDDVGWTVPGVEIRLLDPSGSPVPHGEVGEIVVRTPWQMSGYLVDGTVARVPEEGMRSGDLAVRAPDGRLALRGRLKEMVITGGENVFPVEVERVLSEHPEVAQAAVVGMPDREWGERVEAVVVPASPAGRGVDDHELVARLSEHCRTLLATYKVPKRIAVRDQMPHTTALKIDKKTLKEWLQ